MKKFVIIHNIVNPTRTVLFNKLNQNLAERGYKLKVIFLSESDRNRQWEVKKDFEFDFVVLKSRAVRVMGKDVYSFFINPEILRVLGEENPDTIFCFGWDHLSAYLANIWARRNKKKFMLWVESTANEKSWRRSVTKPLVKLLLRRTDQFVVCGTRAKEYLISLGVSFKKIQILNNTVDIEDISQKICKMSQKDKENLRQKLGIKTKRVILFCGQLIERKGIFELIDAFKEYLQKYPDTTLLILGQGQEEFKLKSIIAENNIKNVVFAGFVQYDQVYQFYAISSLFVLPSHEEVWGLVLNEALAAGLPIITTTVTGAAPDVVEEGKNGYIIPPRSATEIELGIEKVFSHNLDQKNNSADIAKKFILDPQIKRLKI